MRPQITADRVPMDYTPEVFASGATSEELHLFRAGARG